MRHGACGRIGLMFGVCCFLAGCTGAGSGGRAVPGPPGALAIRTVPEEPGGGTMHYARQVTIALAGYEPLVLSTDVAAGTLAPYIRRQYELPGKRYLLLGHSSWGAGTETVQALEQIDPQALKQAREALGIS